MRGKGGGKRIRSKGGLINCSIPLQAQSLVSIGRNGRKKVSQIKKKIKLWILLVKTFEASINPFILNPMIVRNVLSS